MWPGDVRLFFLRVVRSRCFWGQLRSHTRATVFGNSIFDLRVDIPLLDSVINFYQILWIMVENGIVVTLLWCFYMNFCILESRSHTKGSAPSTDQIVSRNRQAGLPPCAPATPCGDLLLLDFVAEVIVVLRPAGPLELRALVQDQLLRPRRREWAASWSPDLRLVLRGCRQAGLPPCAPAAPCGDLLLLD